MTYGKKHYGLLNTTISYNQSNVTNNFIRFISNENVSLIHYQFYVLRGKYQILKS